MSSTQYVDINRTLQNLEDSPIKPENVEALRYFVDHCASYQGSKARALYALFEAKTAVKNIKRTEKQKNLKSRSIPYDPIIIYLGSRCSALQINKIVFTGMIPSLMEKLGVEKRYMWTRKYLL